MKEHVNHHYYRGEVERAQRRLDELNTRGVAALSPFDVKIAHQGDAEQALTTAKWLVGNHVAFFSRKLEALGPEVRQGTLFDVAEAGEPQGGETSMSRRDVETSAREHRSEDVEQTVVFATYNAQQQR